MKFLWATVALIGAFSSVSVHAEALDAIKANKAIRIGVRSDNGGLSYAIGPQEYGGFHVDLCRRVVQDMQAQLHHPIKVEYVPVTGQSRIPMIHSGQIDMECGATTNNQSRQKFAAFAVTTFVEQVRVVVRAQSDITTVAQLDGKTLASTSGTTSLSLIRKYQRGAKTDVRQVLAKNDVESFELMASGKADAYVMDGQIAATLISASEYPERFRMLKEVLSVEPIAIMLAPQSPALKKMVDDSLKAMMRSGEIQTIYNKWLMDPIPPHQTVIGLPVSDSTRKAWDEPNDRPAEAY